MKLPFHRVRAAAVALLALGALALPQTALARNIVVRDGDSIQAAVDAALPGDTIHVKAGTYTAPPTNTRAVVEITTSNLTLVGDPNAVIDATGKRFAVFVGVPGGISPAGCPPITVHGFHIRGFTFQNASNTGVFLVGVRNYRMSHGTYLNNGEYGPFPICSEVGLIDHNFASGHDDAAIYVGDDDGVIVRYNRVTDSAIGIEVENTENAAVTNNVLMGNTAGVLVVVLPGLPKPFTRNVRIMHNTIISNNFPNPVPPDSGDAVGLIPTGTGILNVGGDQVLIAHNVVQSNDSFGIASIGNPFAFAGDPRIEPFVDDLEVRDNVVLRNGANPDPLRATTPGADIIFIPDVVDGATGTVIATDPDPTDNCFEGNKYRTDFPPGIVELFPCP